MEGSPVTLMDATYELVAQTGNDSGFFDQSFAQDDSNASQTSDMIVDASGSAQLVELNGTISSHQRASCSPTSQARSSTVGTDASSRQRSPSPSAPATSSLRDRLEMTFGDEAEDSDFLSNEEDVILFSEGLKAQLAYDGESRQRLVSRLEPLNKRSKPKARSLHYTQNFIENSLSHVERELLSFSTGHVVRLLQRHRSSFSLQGRSSPTYTSRRLLQVASSPLSRHGRAGRRARSSSQRLARAGTGQAQLHRHGSPRRRREGTGINE